MITNANVVKVRSSKPKQKEINDDVTIQKKPNSGKRNREKLSDKQIWRALSDA